MAQGRSWLFVAALSVSVAGCQKDRPLPPAPKLAPGQGYAANIKSFDSAAMLHQCDLTVRLAAQDKLSGYSDAQVVAGLCETTADATELVARHADPGQVCVAATKAMIGEFSHRFARHDPAEAIGRC